MAKFHRPGERRTNKGMSDRSLAIDPEGDRWAELMDELHPEEVGFATPNFLELTHPSLRPSASFEVSETAGLGDIFGHDDTLTPDSEIEIIPGDLLAIARAATEMGYAPSVGEKALALYQRLQSET